MNFSLHAWNLVCRIITCGSKVSVHGKEMLPVGPCILAMNHPTSFDPCYVYGLTRNAAILMTKFVFDLPCAGRLVSGCGFIPVPVCGTNTGGHRAYSWALNELLHGRNILMAPEGKMSPDNLAFSAKTGAVRLSIQSHVPIVPIAINHTGKVYKFMIGDQQARFMPIGRTAISIGPPIQFPIRDNAHEDTKLLMKSIQYQIL